MPSHRHVTLALIASQLGCPVSRASCERPRADAAPAAPRAPTRAELANMSPHDQRTYTQLHARAERAKRLDVAAARAAYPTGFVPTLGYAPKDAQNLARIQASPLALSDAELRVLETEGS